MRLPKLTKREMQIMEALWSRGPLCIRDIQQTFPARRRPAYSTVQTTVYRLEAKGALRRARKISNAHIFEALITRGAARGRLIDELFGLLGGRMQPIMSHLAESGKLTLEDVRQAEEIVRRLSRKETRE